MHLTASILILLGLANCARYTERTSPCIGKSGKPVVARSLGTPLDFAPSVQITGKDCLFEPVHRE